MTQGTVNLKLGLDTSPATQALKQYYAKLNQGANTAAASQTKVTTSLEKVVQSAKKLGLTYDKVTQSFKDSKGAVQTLTQVKQRVNDLNASLAKTKQVADQTLGGIGAGFKQVLQGIPQGIGLAIGQQLLAPLTNFQNVVGGAVSSSVKTFVDIDAALRQTASISGSTEAEFKELQAAVIGLAKDTKFTTGELAEASIALARAGFSAQEVQEALPGIAQGAAAAGQTMAQMSDTVIGAMGGFQKSTEETIPVVDVLTAAANNSNQSVTDLGEALKYVGPIANTLGLSLEDTSAALGLLANAGIRGSQAGTTLRTGLSRLSAAAAGNSSEFADLSRGTGRLAETLKRLGADITDTQGNLLAFPELLKTLKSSLNGLSSTETQLVSKILFGEEAASGFTALLNSTAEDIDEFASITNNATGTAAATSEKNLAGIAGSLTFLSSAFDAASATVGEFLAGIVKPLVDGLTSILNAFNALPGPVKNTIVVVTALGIAVAGATAAYVLFKAALASTNIQAFVSGVTSAVQAVLQFGVNLKANAVAGLVSAKASLLAFNAAMTKQISVSAIATAAQTKFNLSLATMKGIGIKGVLASIMAGFQGVAAGATTAGAAIGKFLIAAAPIAAVAAAIGAVALAWDAYAQTQKAANEVSESAIPIQEGLNKALAEQDIFLTSSSDAFEKSTERVGFFQANLDILRKGIGLTTAEQAQLNQETVRLGQVYGDIGAGVDTLTAKYREQAEALANGTGIGTRAEQLKVLAATEKQVQESVSASVQELKRQKTELIANSQGLDNLTEAESTQLNMLNSLIKSFGLSGDLLDSIKGKYVETADAAGKLGEALEKVDPAEALKAAEADLKKAKTVFTDQMKEMQKSFKDLQDDLGEGVKSEIDGIKSDISGLKDANKAFSKTKGREIDAIKEQGDAFKQAMQESIADGKAQADSRIAQLQRLAQAASEAAQREQAAISKNGAAIAASYEARADAADRAHSRAMSNLNEQLRAIEKQKEAVNSRYDAALEGLRELTPAERQLQALELARLQQQARMGGEEGLRAQAQLERIVRQEQAAEVEKQKAEELKRLEEKRERKQEQMRAKEEAHQEKMAALREQAAAAQASIQRQLQAAQAQAAEEQKKREEEMAAIKEEQVAKEKAQQEELARVEEAQAQTIKKLEEERRVNKEKTDKAILAALETIAGKEKEESERKKQAEEEFATLRENLMFDYKTSIADAGDVVVRSGQAWNVYADNAVLQLGRVEQAARLATAAAAAANNAGDTRWTGGPVSAGQNYTVNELGQEAFLSSTGKLSMIDAPAFGRWKAPSKGTVINAAQTEKLGLPSAPSEIGSGPAINTRGGLAAQSASGNETRNLLRAIAKATGGDNITNNVTIQAANTTQAASDVMVDLTKIKRRRLR